MKRITADHIFEGPMECFLVMNTQRTTSMKFLSNKLIYSGFILNIIIILLTAWISVARFKNNRNIQSFAIHRDSVVILLQKTHSAINLLQSNVKDFAITGDERHIAQLNTQEFEIEKNIQDLKRLLSIAQLKRLQGLEAAIRKKIESHDHLIENVKYKNFQLAKSTFSSEENIALTDTINSAVDSMIATENTAYHEAQIKNQVTDHRFGIAFTISFALSIILLSIVLLILRQYLHMQKRSEDLLNANRHLLQSIIDNSSNPVFVKDIINGEYLLANKKFENYFGKKTNAKGKTDHDLFSKEIADNRRGTDLEVLKTGKELKFEEVLPHNGESHTYVTVKFPIRDQQDKIYALGGISTDISEHAEMDFLLKESEEQIQTIFDAAPDAIIVIDTESKIIKWNHKSEELFKWQAHEVVGRPMPEVIMPERYRELHAKGMKRFLETGEGPILNKTIEIWAQNKDNVEFEIELTISTGRIKDKYIFISFIREISKKRELEKENQETKKFLDSIIENMPDMIIVKDAKDLRFVRLNRSGERLLGYSRKDILGWSDYDFFPKEQADFSTSKDREVLEKGTLLDIAEEMVETSTGQRLLHTKKLPIVDDKNKPAFILTISEDITEKKKLETERNDAFKQLRESEEKIARILENIGDAVIAIDAKNTVTFMNAVAEQLTGWKESEAQLQPIDTVFEIVNEATREKVNNPATQAMLSKKITGLERNTILVRKDKSEIHIDDSGSPILNERGEVIGAVLIFRDITEQMEADKLIRESEKRFSQIFNLSPVPISISTAEEGIFMYVNDAFCKALGYEPDELTGRRSVDLNILSEEQRKKIKEEAIRSGNRVRDIETRVRKKNGEVMDVLYSIESLQIDGQMCAAIAFVDITERKNEEKRIGMVLENIGEGVVVADPEQHVLLSNQMANDILGIEDEHYSSDWTERYDIYYPDGRTIFPAQNLPIEKALRGEALYDTELVLLDPETKRRKLLRVSGQPVFSEDDKLIAAVATLKDITKLRDTEKALKASELKYRKLIGFGRDKDNGNPG